MSEITVAQAELNLEKDLKALHELSPAIQQQSVNRFLWYKEVGLPLGYSILGFGLCVMMLVAWLIRKGSNIGHVIRAFALVLIIISSIFLIVTGYDEQQIAPVLGLLGTIAGYLLGNNPENKPQSGPVQGGSK